MRRKKGKYKKEGRTEHLSQFGVVNEVRSVSVDEGAQSQAVLPTEPREEEGKVGETPERKVGRFIRQGRMRRDKKVGKKSG